MRTAAWAAFVSQVVIALQSSSQQLARPPAITTPFFLFDSDLDAEAIVFAEKASQSRFSLNFPANCLKRSSLRETLCKVLFDDPRCWLLTFVFRIHFQRNQAKNLIAHFNLFELIAAADEMETLN